MDATILLTERGEPGKLSPLVLRINNIDCFLSDGPEGCRVFIKGRLDVFEICEHLDEVQMKLYNAGVRGCL